MSNNSTKNNLIHECQQAIGQLLNGSVKEENITITITQCYKNKKLLWLIDCLNIEGFCARGTSEIDTLVRFRDMILGEIAEMKFRSIKK